MPFDSSLLSITKFLQGNVEKLIVGGGGGGEEGRGGERGGEGGEVLKVSLYSSQVAQPARA